MIHVEAHAAYLLDGKNNHSKIINTYIQSNRCCRRSIDIRMTNNRIPGMHNQKSLFSIRSLLESRSCSDKSEVDVALQTQEDLENVCTPRCSLLSPVPELLTVHRT